MPTTKEFHLGTQIDSADVGHDASGRDANPVIVPWDDLKVHALLNGSSGSGKSRTATALALDAFAQNIPTVVIDKHGDTVEDIAAQIAAKAVKLDPEAMKKLLRRVHFLEWGPFYCPRLDPFHFPVPAGLHRDFAANALAAAGEALVDQIAGHLQSATQGKEGFEGTPRLQRQLKNGLFGCVRPSPRRRLPLAAMPVLLNVLHPRHSHVYERVAPTLPLASRADFDHLHTLRPEKAFEQIESGLNRTSGFFSKVISESFGTTSESAPIVDFGSIIRKGHLLLVNLRETPYFSHAQGVTLGRLLSCSVVETLMRLPRDERTSGCLLLIEEAGEIIHEPFLRYLGAVRKYGCRMVFCGQDLSTFVKPTVNLVPKLLSQVGLVMSFNQRYPADAAMLSELMFQGAVDRTPLVHEVEREGPLQWLQVEDESKSGQTGHSLSAGMAASSGQTRTQQKTQSKSLEQGWSNQENTQDAEAEGDSSGSTLSTGHAIGASLASAPSSLEPDRRTTSDQQSTSRAETAQTTTTRTRTHGRAATASGSQTNALARGTGTGESTEQSHNQALSITDSKGWSVSKRWVHLATKVRALQATGQLQHGPTAEQLAAWQAVLMELPPRLAVIKRQGEPAVFVRTREVPDAYASPLALAKSIDWLKRMMLQLHSYLFIPDLSPEREDARIREFLEQLQPLLESDAEVTPDLVADDGSSPLNI